MKNILYFLLISISISSCVSKTAGDIIDNDCCSAPRPFMLYIKKSSEIAESFLIQSDVPKNTSEDIYFYTLNGSMKQKYETSIGVVTIGNEKTEYVAITTGNSLYESSIYTGKTETIYLQNATKTYKIEVNGNMVSRNGCCPVGELKEIKIDGLKIEGNYWVK